jgi:hypothetical protein
MENLEWSKLMHMLVIFLSVIFGLKNMFWKLALLHHQVKILSHAWATVDGLWIW